MLRCGKSRLTGLRAVPVHAMHAVVHAHGCVTGGAPTEGTQQPMFNQMRWLLWSSPLQ